VFKNHESNEIFTLPRNHEKPSKSLKIMRFSHCPEIIKKPSVFKNHESNEIFTLPRNHEKPSKCLKVTKAMRFSHCPEIMKNRQKV
jgi:hypothetical protein